MTSTQQQQLDSAWAEYLNKKAAYNTAVDVYNGFKSLPVAPKYKDLMDAAKLAMDNSLVAFNTLKDTISQADQAAFNAANPSAAVAIAQTQAQAATDAAAAQAEGKRKEAETQAKALIDMQAATFAQNKSKTMLYAGIGFLFVVVVAVIYVKVSASKAKTPAL